MSPIFWPTKASGNHRHLTIVASAEFGPDTLHIHSFQTRLCLKGNTSAICRGRCKNIDAMYTSVTSACAPALLAYIRDLHKHALLPLAPPSSGVLPPLLSISRLRPPLWRQGPALSHAEARSGQRLQQRVPNMDALLRPAVVLRLIMCTPLEHLAAQRDRKMKRHRALPWARNIPMFVRSM